jgi:hypothetical protein
LHQHNGTHYSGHNSSCGHGNNDGNGNNCCNNRHG